MSLHLYLETSVVSAHEDDRYPERKQATVEFWTRLGQYEVAVSELTVTEVEATGDSELRERMVALIRPFSVLSVTGEAHALAGEYIRRGVFSPATVDDALHVAVAVASGQNLLVSWNFRHLVNRRRRALINDVNVLLDHPTIEIVAPPEV